MPRALETKPKVRDARRKGLDAKDARKKHLTEWVSFLLRPDILESLLALGAVDFTESTPSLTMLRNEAARIWQESVGAGVSVVRLAELLNQVQSKGDCPQRLLQAIMHFSVCKKAATLPSVSHREKWAIATELGLLKKPYYVKDLLSGARPRDSIPQFQLRERVRDHSHGFKERRHLSEVVDGDAYVTNSDTGFETIGEDESAIYFSWNYGKLVIELAVLRNVAGDAKCAPVFFEWAYSVIEEACTERRDVRPNDQGVMVQLGLNMGARHARAIGLADNFKRKNMQPGTKAAHDQDAVGVISLAWGLMEKLMPQEVIDETKAQLRRLKLPELETANLPSGGGYTVRIGDRELTFPTAKRAPPEGYLSQGYEARTHIDKAYTPYAFTLNVDRRINPKKVPRPGPDPVYQTRGSSKRQKKEPKPPVAGPPGGGSSFVDVSLKVVVRQAPGTMMAIRPEFIHGTTKGYGAENSGITISFSERIVDPWMAALAGGVTVKSFQATDDGN